MSNQEIISILKILIKPYEIYFYKKDFNDKGNINKKIKYLI